MADSSFYSVVFMLVSIFVFQWSYHKKHIHVFYSITVAFYAACFALFLFIRKLFYNGHSDEIWTYFNAAFTNKIVYEYKWFVYSSLISILVVSLLGYLVFYYTNKNKTGKKSSSLSVISLLFLLASFFLNPLIYDFINFKYAQYSKNVDAYSEFRKLYHVPKIGSNAVNNPPNIIYIYMESLEHAYFNHAYFNNVVPELEVLEKNSVSFSNMRQLPYMGMTIAGMVAGQCGVPFSNISDRVMEFANKIEGVNPSKFFMNRAFCLGDFLNDFGYELNYIGGALSSFTNKGDFYSSHGFSKVYGLENLKDKIPDKNYINEWGIYDDDMFNIAYNKFVDLSKKNKPFGLFMINLDTHGESGYPSKACDKIIDTNDETILHSVRCSSYLISSFVNRIRSSGIDKNTVIVLSSDHLAPFNEAISQVPNDKRFGTFMINFPDGRSKIIDKPGSSLDIGATILDAIGADENKLGLGASLLSDKKTIAGSEHPDNIIYKIYKPSMALWGIADFSKGISYSPKSKLLKIGEKEAVKSALYMTFSNNDLYIDDFELGDDIVSEGKTSPDYDYKAMSGILGDRVVWFDNCNSMVKYLGSTESRINNGRCLFIGKLGYKGGYYKNVDKGVNISRNDIVKYISSSLCRLGRDNFYVKNSLLKNSNVNNLAILLGFACSLIGSTLFIRKLGYYSSGISTIVRNVLNICVLTISIVGSGMFLIFDCLRHFKVISFIFVIALSFVLGWFLTILIVLHNFDFALEYANKFF